MVVVVVVIYLHDDVFRTGVVAELEVFHRCLRIELKYISTIPTRRITVDNCKLISTKKCIK